MSLSLRSKFDINERRSKGAIADIIPNSIQFNSIILFNVFSQHSDFRQQPTNQKQKTNKQNYNKLLNGRSTRALAILNIKLLSLNKMSVVPHIRISSATPCFSYSVSSCGQSNII